MGQRLVGECAERLGATAHGRGDTWLVLSHGFGTSQAVWGPIIRRYGDRHRILTYNLAYIGQCERDEPLYRDLSTYADDLIALLDEQGIRQATLLGHSASGMIGLLASVVEPALFSDLILLNASPRFLDDVDYPGGLSQSELEATCAAIRANYSSWVLAFGPAVTAESAGAGLSDFSRHLLALRPDAALAVLRSIYEADLRSILPRVPCGVALIQSRLDRAVPVEVGAYMAQRIPVSQLVLLDIEGHLPHLTTPELVWPALDDLLGRDV